MPCGVAIFDGHPAWRSVMVMMIADRIAVLVVLHHEAEDGAGVVGVYLRVELMGVPELK